MSDKSSGYFSGLHGELKFQTSRSGGPGGQHVNKVNSKVTMHWDIRNSQLITEAQKELLSRKLKNYLTKDGVLVLSAQNTRSQIQNKEEVIAKLNALIAKSMTPRKKRKPTKPTKTSRMKRLDKKKSQGEKKKWRRKI